MVVLMSVRLGVCVRVRVGVVVLVLAFDRRVRGWVDRAVVVAGPVVRVQRRRRGRPAGTVVTADRLLGWRAGLGLVRVHLSGRGNGLRLASEVGVRVSRKVGEGGRVSCKERGV